MFNFHQYLEDQTALINRELDRRLPTEIERPAVLHKAMRYSVFAGGKRLRPVICLAAAEAVGGAGEQAIVPALAIEILHTYTLIHDDLPAMDDDELRRGQPTCHVAFGEANAILAGDALLTLAFEWLAAVTAPTPYPPNQLSLELARAAGSRGVIAGQAEDLAAEGAPPDAALVDYIHRHKTAELMRAAARMGGIVAGADEAQLQTLTVYGEKVGLAFQIVDDMLNATSTVEALGKAAGSDIKRGKLTYVAVHGLEVARKNATLLSRQAAASIRTIGNPAAPLAALAEFMLERVK